MLSENTGPHRAAGRQTDPHRTAGQMAKGVGGSNEAIAETLGIDKVDVCAGTRHSIERGLEPVMDRLRGALVCELPHTDGLPITDRTAGELADTGAKRGIAGRLSDGHVRKVLVKGPCCRAAAANG